MRSTIFAAKKIAIALSVSGALVGCKSDKHFYSSYPVDEPTSAPPQGQGSQPENPGNPLVPPQPQTEPSPSIIVDPPASPSPKPSPTPSPSAKPSPAPSPKPSPKPSPSPSPKPSPSPAPIPTYSHEQSFDPKVGHQVPVTLSKPIDLIWVVDNSGSMEDNQEKLARGFEAFAHKYLRADYDIRLAVIPTDLYLTGKKSHTQFQYYDYNYPSEYAFLLPGIADGVRPPLHEGTRSGQPILSTIASNKASPEAWVSDLAKMFAINAKVGIQGSGDERGMQSITTLLEMNEKTESRFFRKGAMRGIIVLSDEEDNTTFTGNTYPTMITSKSGLAKDKNSTWNMKTGKEKIDNFFKTLDGGTSSANWFVTTIVNPTLMSKGCSLVRCEWGRKYKNLVDQVAADATNALGSFSSTADINESNYDSILDRVALTFDSSRTVYDLKAETELAKTPISGTVKVSLVLAGTGTQALNASDYAVSGKTVRLLINVDSLNPKTKVKITYQSLEK